jgi:hypothetical protein
VRRTVVAIIAVLAASGCGSQTRTVTVTTPQARPTSTTTQTASSPAVVKVAPKPKTAPAAPTAYCTPSAADPGDCAPSVAGKCPSGYTPNADGGVLCVPTAPKQKCVTEADFATGKCGGTAAQIAAAKVAVTPNPPATTTPAPTPTTSSPTPAPAPSTQSACPSGLVDTLTWVATAVSTALGPGTLTSPSAGSSSRACRRPRRVRSTAPSQRRAVPRRRRRLGRPREGLRRRGVATARPGAPARRSASSTGRVPVPGRCPPRCLRSGL